MASSNGRMRLASLALVVFFFAWGIYTFLYDDRILVFDRLLSGTLLLLIYASRKKSRVNLPIFASIATLLLIHNVNLYDAMIFGMSFDRLMHFASGATIALFAYNYLRHINFHISSRRKMEFLERAVVVIFLSFGLASFVEILEFVGYSYFNASVGILGYGIGDIGEWNNLSWDLISNMLGATAGVLLSRFVFWRKR